MSVNPNIQFEHVGNEYRVKVNCIYSLDEVDEMAKVISEKLKGLAEYQKSLIVRNHG